MSTILVITEIQNNDYKKASLEAVSQAGKLAGALGQPVTALIIGAGVQAKSAQLGEYGATTVLTADDAKLANYNPDYYKAVVVKAVQETGAATVIFSATTQGNDLAPRVAATLQTSLAADCIALDATGGKLLAERSLFAGKVFAKIELAAPVRIVSLRPGVFPVIQQSGKTATVKPLSLPALESKLVVKQVSKTGGDKLDVTDADIIVTGGRGMRSADGFKHIEDLAGKLGAAVGATRAVVDSGWRPHSEQVGQTGKVVSPKLYIMCGASGSIQHWAGMSGSKCIVAINKDPEAPIIKRADYSIVGDVFEVLPALTAEVAKIKS
ncbi:MAG TPA: electron transfer flavoprotein subunit alpha/FixB family protein [bacterium]|nr:electron transfer flavoprotein subunit alpha/FixB family protein [bacterium]HPN42192.1 electron transfer flavoprotein subunit alpha/FixB family protein [bacterium]